MDSIISSLLKFSASPHIQAYLQRLLDADCKASFYDCLTLVRYVLQENKNKGALESMTIPILQGFEELEFEKFGLKSIRQADNLIVSLSQASEEILSDISAWNKCEQVRQDESIGADYFFPYPKYMHKGQKEAVKAFVEAQYGSTTVIQLPTGSGKSVLFHLPLLLAPKDRFLNIVIVPTVALALDQEMRVHNHPKLFSDFKHKLAWHGGLSDFDRDDLKSRIRNGTQRILFLNPETLTRALVNVLFDARNTIRNFFIDEAHIIGEWGDSFRPAFQDLAVFRNALQRGNHYLRTFLLSATINDYNANLFSDMFSDEGGQGVDFFAYNFMREEPKYFQYKVEDSEKLDVFIKFFRHLPRPAIIYANTPAEVQKYSLALLENGHESFRIFTGKTCSEEREEILAAWNQDEIQVIVATSAFGVGVDKPNVRAVMHVSIPESFDRFYQEVGRGGRDGLSSTSVVLYSEDDLHRNPNIKKMGEDTAWRRWLTLCRESKTAGFSINNERLNILDSSVTPANVLQQSEANEIWNNHILRFLDNKKFIKRHMISPTEFKQNIFDGNDDIDEFFSDFRKKIPVQFLKEMYQDEKTFKEVYSEAENARTSARENSFNLLRNFLQKDISMEDALSKTYDIKSLGIMVSKACRGCHAHEHRKERLTRPHLKQSSLHKSRNEAYLQLYKSKEEGTDSRGYIFYQSTDQLWGFVGYLVKSLEIVEVIFHGQDTDTFDLIKSRVTNENKAPVFFEAELTAHQQLNLTRPQLLILGRDQAELPDRDDLLGASNCLVLLPKNIKLGYKDLKDSVPKPFLLSDYARMVSK